MKLSKIKKLFTLALLLPVVSGCATNTVSPTTNSSDGDGSTSVINEPVQFKTPVNIRVVNGNLVWNYIEDCTNYRLLFDETFLEKTSTNSFKLTEKYYHSTVVITALPNEGDTTHLASNPSNPYTINYDPDKVALNTPRMAYKFYTNDSFTVSLSNDPWCNVVRWTNVDNATHYRVYIYWKDTGETKDDETDPNYDFDLQGIPDIVEEVSVNQYEVFIYEMHTNFSVKVVATDRTGHYLDSLPLLAQNLEFYPKNQYIPDIYSFSKKLGSGINAFGRLHTGAENTGHTLFNVNKLMDGNNVETIAKDTAGYTDYHFFTSFWEMINQYAHDWSFELEITIPVEYVEFSFGNGYSFSEEHYEYAGYRAVYWFFHYYVQRAIAQIIDTNTDLMAQCVNQAFLRDLSRLSSENDADDFFAKYGTHYIAEASFGGTIEGCDVLYGIGHGKYDSIKESYSAFVGAAFAECPFGVKTSSEWVQYNASGEYSGQFQEDFQAH